MAHRPDDPAPSPKDQRAERLAEALRANLKRRKLADRARREARSSDPAASDPAIGAGGDEG